VTKKSRASDSLNLEARRDDTIKMLIIALCVILATISMVNGGIVIVEAGPYAIIMDQDIEINEAGGTNFWHVFGFEHVDSRELIRSNYYDLKMTGLFEKDETGFISVPKSIMFSEKPLGTIYFFTPKKVKNVTVGRLNPINTTLWSGTSWADSKKMPYLANFTIDGLYCEVYDPNTSESSITEFLKDLDIIKKDDIGKYASKLWSEKD
jgi:hypothetical protein